MAVVTSTLNHVCPASLLALDAVVGTKRKMEHATGLLDAILDDPNYNAFNGQFVNPMMDYNTGHFKSVRLMWDVRLSPTLASTTYDNICDVTCVSRPSPEVLVTVDEKAAICINRTEAQIRRLCDEFSQVVSDLPLKQRGNFPLPEVMSRLGKDLWSAISVVRKRVNDRLRQLLNAQAPTFVFAGPVPSPSPLPLPLTTSNADAIRSGALVRMFREFSKAEYDGDIIVVSDLNAMYDAKVLLGASCCNLQGIDNRVLVGDRIWYYLDKGFNMDFAAGTNEFLAWIPGAIRLVTQNEFISNDGNLGLAYGGNFWQTVIPDPIHGEKLFYDVRIQNDGCGTISITIQALFDLVIRPNVYDATDELSGVRDIFRFEAETQDPCVTVCP